MMLFEFEQSTEAVTQSWVLFYVQSESWKSYLRLSKRAGERRIDLCIDLGIPTKNVKMMLTQ
jgi:hypothetical protein